MFSSSGLKAMALGASTKWSARLSPMESCLEYFSTSLSECHSVVWDKEVALVFTKGQALLTFTIVQLVTLPSPATL